MSSKKKGEILEDLKKLFLEGKVTKTEILSVLEDSDIKRQKIDISQILYYMGAGVVALGVIILVSNFWDRFSDIFRVIITLGVGFLSYAIGAFSFTRRSWQGMGIAFHVIAAALLPFGMFVFSSIVLGAPGYAVATIVFALMEIIYLASFYERRTITFLIFNIIFSLLFFFAFTAWLSDVGGFSSDGARLFLEYRFLFSGSILTLFGYYLSSGRYRTLTNFCYSVGLSAALGAGIAIGGFYPYQNIFWETLYPVFIFAVLYLSVELKNRSVLTLGGVCFFGYIFKITSEYFSKSLGWPATLIILGFVLIGIGYMTIHLNNKVKKVQK
jgi:hypothetical protein